jgi:aminoglycoside phosphotransferase (APT) family kinase protein
MASTPLTLAALATSAVPGLHVLGARSHSDGGSDDYTSAVLVTEHGELIVRVPRNSAAEVRQSGELLGLAALADGARSALPFEVPETRGITRAGDTRAVVTTFLPGGRVSAESIESDALLLQPVAEAVAAIHALPVSLVQQAGLPMRSAEEAREQAARLVARAGETRLLPETLHAHWDEALGTARLWDFAPTVVHGSLDADRLLVENDAITGVLGWSELSVGDPAADLSWLLAAGFEVLDAVLSRYAVQRGMGGLRELRARAVLSHELEVARWLLHGVESHDEAVVEDAVGMLDRLVDRLGRAGTAGPLSSSSASSGPALTEAEVRQLLEETPDVPVDPRTETAEFEALDEDRQFLVDPDFRDAPEAPGGGDSAEQAAGPDDTGDSAAEQAARRAQAGEHPTEPIDPLERD